MPGGFSFNQYLVVDDEPLLFHIGLRKMFPLVRQAIEHVLPVTKLRWLAFSHFEADECGAMNDSRSRPVGEAVVLDDRSARERERRRGS